MLERPKLLSIFGEGVLAHHLRGEIENQIRTELRSFLYQHGRRLRDWLDRALRELKTAFDAAADICRARFGESAPTGIADRQAMERDLNFLKEWTT